MADTLLSEKELTRKTALMISTYTKEELACDDLYDVLAYLIALRDGHKTGINTGQAIRRINTTLELLEPEHKQTRKKTA